MKIELGGRFRAGCDVHEICREVDPRERAWRTDRRDHAGGLRIVAVGHRAPELLYGDADFGTGVDMFASGAVVLDMASQPLLPLAFAAPWRSEKHDVEDVFGAALHARLGRPPECTRARWPKYRAPVALRNPAWLACDYKPLWLVLGGPGLDLANSLMDWDCKKRPSGEKVLTFTFCDPTQVFLLGFVAPAGSPIAHGLSGL